jgi:hypothetical protein
MRPSKGERFELVLQVLIMLAIFGAGAAASFGHVISVVMAHGQVGWFAWADAIVLELMSLSSGLEMRRRRKRGQSIRMPLGVLAVAVGLSLGAQLIEAEPTVIGWIVASIPSLGFLAQAKMILGRKPANDAPAAAPVVAEAPAAPVAVVVSEPTEMAELESPDLPEAPVSPAVGTPTAPKATAQRRPYGPRKGEEGYSERHQRRQRTGK